MTFAVCVCGIAVEAWTICMSPDDRVVAGGSHKGVINIWSVENRSAVTSFETQSSFLTSVAFVSWDCHEYVIFVFARSNLIHFDRPAPVAGRHQARRRRHRRHCARVRPGDATTAPPAGRCETNLQHDARARSDPCSLFSSPPHADPVDPIFARWQEDIHWLG